MDKGQNQNSKSTPQTEESKRLAAREVVDTLHEISVLLNTNLDRMQLSLCVSMIENGVNPEALANVIMDLRAQAQALHQGDENGA